MPPPPFMFHLLQGIDARHASVLLKCAIAIWATMLLAWRASPANAGGRGIPFADKTLAVLGLLAVLSWWHVGAYQFGVAFHRWEFFHYYLGAKYSPELGYTRLYDCSAAAEAEDSPSPELLTRWTRNLETNVMERGSPAAIEPGLCRSRFTPARWLEFKHDVLFFREEAKTDWLRMQQDHGYNATPVWNAAGYLLANTGPATKRQMVLIALIDPALLALMWVAVWRTFGWRPAAVAAIWWGTNFPARYFYLGGSFVRSDFLVAAVLAVVLAKRGYMMMAGAATCWSTLLRIFPGFLISGPVVRALTGEPGARSSLKRSLGPLVRFAAGGCIAVCVLIPFSLLSPPGGVSAGIGRWTGFVRNSDKHLSGSSVNRVGLKPLLSFTRGGDYRSLRDFWIENPDDAWQAVRHQTFQGRRWLFWGLTAAFLVLLGLAARGQPYWVALVLGVGLIPIVSDIACYYYGILLVYGLLWDRYPWTGVGLASLSVFTLIAGELSSTEEVRYLIISAGIVFYVFAVTGGIARSNMAAWRQRVIEQPAA
ncbi:MAG TPA: hypothetical protein VFI12_03890 [Thermomicrobiales bacterium]|nr:hypothetical protein [Thermomicrobiales bacterium]